jgi:purine-binding chemotaxis protein CheW
MAGRDQFCTFFLDGHFFGVPVQQVQEVIGYQEMTRVPMATRIIRGLINLRGQIVTAIDLRLCLGMAERPADHFPMNVVVCTDDGAFSLLVDGIGDVIEVEEKTFEQPPETLRGTVGTMIPGVHKLNGRLMHVLDIRKVCEMGNRDEVTASSR